MDRSGVQNFAGVVQSVADQVLFTAEMLPEGLMQTCSREVGDDWITVSSATCQRDRDHGRYESDHEVALTCSDQGFRSFLVNIMIMPLAPLCPNVRQIRKWSRCSRGYFSGISGESLKIQVDPVTCTLAELLSFSPKFTEAMSRAGWKWENRQAVVDNALVQCMSFLALMQQTVKMVMLGDLNFKRISVAVGKGGDLETTPKNLMYRDGNKEWQVPYLGFTIKFHSFEYTKVRVPSHLAPWAAAATGSTSTTPRYLKFTHSAAFLGQSFTGDLFLSDRAKFWDTQLEAYDAMPAMDPAQLVNQAMFYEFGMYSLLSRIYMSLEGMHHDRTFGNRKKLHRPMYQQYLFMTLVGEQRGIFTDNAYFYALLQENEVAFTTAREVLQRLMANAESGTTLNALKAAEILARAGTTAYVPPTLPALAREYGRGTRSIYLPEPLLNIKSCERLASQLARGIMDTTALSKVGQLSNSRARQCAFCLKNAYTSDTSTDCNQTAGEDVMPSTCSNPPDYESRSCSRTSQIDRLTPHDPFWIAGGKQGQVFKGFLCSNCTDPAAGELLPVAIKRFPPEQSTQCDGGEGQIVACSEFLNEVAASLVTSQHYDTGRSPHYIKVHSVFRCSPPNPEVEAPTLAVERFFMVMERIHGTMSDLGRLISVVEHNRALADQPLLGQETYMLNCLAQTVCILRLYQETLEGMHLDFHPGNAFVKLTDDTPYQGKKIADLPSFNFTFQDGTKMSIPNLGLMVKLGDMGHARLRPTPTTLIMRQPVRETKELGARIAANVTRWFTQVPYVPSALKDIGRFFEQSSQSSYMRVNNRFIKSYDLACFMNNLSVNPDMFNHPVVLRYHELEKLSHLKTRGDLTDYNGSRLNAILFALADLPTAYVPKLGTTYVTPESFLRDPIFNAYRS